MTLENGIKPNPYTFEFDVYIKSNGADFILTSYQCSFSFNKTIRNGGNLSFNLIEGSSELTNYPSAAIGIDNSGTTWKLQFASNSGSDIISNQNKKVGRFRISNTNVWANVLPEIKWNFAGLNNTILTDINFNDITEPLSHTNLEYYDPLPVELISFTGKSVNGVIELYWETSSEINNYGFYIEKKTGDENDSWENIGFVKGAGNSTNNIKYNFIDDKVIGGKSIYRLKQIDHNMNYNYSVIIEIDYLPLEFILYQNYPNPFNPSTTISFSLPSASKVFLSVHNVLGETIEILIENYLEKGIHNFVWNASDYPSGTYFVTIKTVADGSNTFYSTKKMILLK
jgi:hypothetical protein